MSIQMFVQIPVSFSFQISSYLYNNVTKSNKINFSSVHTYICVCFIQNYLIFNKWLQSYTQIEKYWYQLVIFFVPLTFLRLVEESGYQHAHPHYLTISINLELNRLSTKCFFLSSSRNMKALTIKCRSI